MAGENKAASLPLFPIQLRKVDIGEVVYRCQGFSDPSVMPTTEFQLSVIVSPFVEAQKSLQVTLSFRSESTPPGSPIPHAYFLSMALHGEFGVTDLERLKMDAEGIRKWGERNGALVLLPFLREAVYSFTQKTGFRPLLIPLVETAAFRVTPPPRPVKALSAEGGTTTEARSNPVIV